MIQTSPSANRSLKHSAVPQMTLRVLFLGTKTFVKFCRLGNFQNITPFNVTDSNIPKYGDQIAHLLRKRPISSEYLTSKASLLTY